MSLFANVCDIAKGVAFTNVLNSSKDPKVMISDITENGFGQNNSNQRETTRLNWLNLWKLTTGNTSGRIKCLACGKKNATVGGHIVLRDSQNNGAPREASSLYGSNRVFIAPLCSCCNSKIYTDRPQAEMIFHAAYSGRIVHLWAFGEDKQRPVKWNDTNDFPLDRFRIHQARLDASYENKLRRRRRSETALKKQDQITLKASSRSDSSHASVPSRPSKPLYYRNSAMFIIPISPAIRLLLSAFL